MYVDSPKPPILRCLRSLLVAALTSTFPLSARDTGTTLESDQRSYYQTPIAIVPTWSLAFELRYQQTASGRNTKGGRYRRIKERSLFGGIHIDGGDGRDNGGQITGIVGEQGKAEAPNDHPEQPQEGSQRRHRPILRET